MSGSARWWLRERMGSYLVWCFGCVCCCWHPAVADGGVLHYSHANRLSLPDGDGPAMFIVALIPRHSLATEVAFQAALSRASRRSAGHGNLSVRVVVAETQCHPGWAMRDLFNLLHRLPRAFALLGCGCPELTGPISQMSFFWNITMVSYEDTSPELADQQRYRNLVRVAPSEADANWPRLRLLRLFNWTKTGSLYQDAAGANGSDSSQMAAANAKLSDLLEAQGIDASGLASARFLSFDSATAALQLLKAKQYRVISAFVRQPGPLATLFCAAFTTGVFGKRHVWLVSGLRLHHDGDNNLRQRLTCSNGGGCNCTDAQLTAASNGSFFIDLVSLHGRGFGLRGQLRGTPVSGQFQAAYAFDSVLAVKRAAEAVLMSGGPSRLRSLDLMKEMLGLDFQGITGRVRFSNNARLGFLSLSQLQATSSGTESRLKFLSEFDCAAGVFTDESKLFSDIAWPAGKPPRDRTEIEIRVHHLQLWLFAIFTCLSAAGICMSLVLMSVNIRYRGHPYIKMSSPQMNNLIVLGCVLCYAAVTLLATDGSMVSGSAVLLPRICTARAWVLSIGFTLAFGAMFSKTWRVHCIFTNIGMSRKIIKDYQLMLIVLLLLLIDIGILIAWTVLDPMWSKRQIIGIESQSDDREVHSYHEVCISKRPTLWLGLLFAYKGLLMIIGCFFAWETRSVSIPALNDSKYIGLSVYNVLVMCVSGAAVNFALQDTNQTASFVITSVLILSCNSITLGLVFFPKLIEIRRDPRGEQRRGRATLLARGASGQASIGHRNQHPCLQHEHGPRKQQQLPDCPALTRSNPDFGAAVGRALEENWQLRQKLDMVTAELETATQAKQLWTQKESRKAAAAASTCATDLTDRSLLFDFIDGEKETESPRAMQPRLSAKADDGAQRQLVWLPRPDFGRRRRVESDEDSFDFDQHIADVQERLLASEARLATPEPDLEPLNESRSDETISQAAAATHLCDGAMTVPASCQ